MENFTNFIISFFDLSTNFIDDDDDYIQTLNESMDTYYDELFRISTDKLRVDLHPINYEHDEQVCKICYDNIHKGEKVYDLECKDVFHCLCLENAVNRNHNQCPICQSKLPIRPKTPENI